MRLLDRYLLAEWLKALGLALGATLAVLLLEDLYSNVGDLLADGAHGTQVIYYYRLLLPGFIPAVLPLSQLVSLLFVIGNFHRNNEIIAMRSAGLSLGRIAWPLYLGGAVLAGLLGWMDATVVPASVEQSSHFREKLHLAAESRIKPAGEVGLIKDLIYDNGADHRLWFFNSFNQETDRAFGLSVFEFDANGQNKDRILAREGHYDDSTSQWVLESGRIITFANGQSVNSQTFDKKTFPAWQEKPELMLTLHKKAGDLSVDELHGAMKQGSAADNRTLDAFAVQYYAILAKPLICLLIVALAMPFATAGVRSSPMVGMSKAVGLFFLYYFVSGVSTHLGNQHYLPAMLAAWLPIMAMLGLAAWFFRKAA